MRFGATTLVLILFFSSISASAQIHAIRARMPKDDAESQKMVGDVKSPALPRPEFAYQAMQDAVSHADEYLAIQEQNESILKELPGYENRFTSFETELKEQAKNCNPNQPDTIRLINRTIIPDGIDLLDLELEEEGEFKEFADERHQLSNDSPTALCAALKDTKTWSLFDQARQTGMTQRKSKATNEAKWAGDLESAWRDRAKLLEKESSTAVASSLSEDLWKIVTVLAAFAIGLLVLMRYFSYEIQVELVSSGQLIQLPTTMLLLVSILILGLGGKIQENTIGTLLGGLAGYVLAQGIGRAAARQAANSSTPPTAVAPTQPQQKPPITG